MSIYKLSFKNFKRRKLRSALTMLGIIIGVTALVVLMGLSSGMTSYMKEQTQTMMGDVTITNSSGGSGMMGSSSEYLNPKAVSKIKNMSQLYDIEEQVQFTTTLNSVPIYVSGISDWDQAKDQVNINGTPGVVISEGLVDRFDYKIGSNITIKDKKFTVTGITDVETMGMEFVALDADKAILLNNNKVTSITANTNGDPETVAKEIENTVNETTAMTQSDFTKQIDEMMNGIMLFVGALASIALLVGIISIINIMLVNVSERTREIGVLKAIGFTNREILGSILAEAGLLGFIGAIFGVIISAVIMQIGIMLFSQQLGMGDVTIIQMLPLWLIGGVIAGAALLSVLAGLYPAWRASRLNVVEALRYE